MTHFSTTSTGAMSLRSKHSLKQTMSQAFKVSYAFEATVWAWLTAFEATLEAEAAAEEAIADAEEAVEETISLAVSTKLGAWAGASFATSTFKLILDRISSDFVFIEFTIWSVFSSTDSFY